MGDKIWTLVYVLAFGGLAGGCGEKTGRDKTAPVSGSVTFQGQAVTEGRIMFYPIDGRRMAIGGIDAEGHYSLTTYEKEDGAFLGEHKVVIDAVREVAAGPSKPDEELGSTEPSYERIVPAIYADRKSSPLEAVVEDKANTLNFDIQE